MKIAVTGMPRLVLESLESHLGAKHHQALNFAELVAMSMADLSPKLPNLTVLAGLGVNPEHLRCIERWQSGEPSVRVVAFRGGGARRYPAGLRIAGVLSNDTTLEGLERVLLGQTRATVPRQRNGSDWSPDQELSSREQEVLRLLVRGCSSAQISRELGLSVGTIHSHVQGAMRKLGARDRVEAVHRYITARSPLDLGTP